MKYVNKYPLTSEEQFWSKHAMWLKVLGYELRPRYQPNWIPSWKTDRKRDPEMAEDARVLGFRRPMDAIRMSDGIRVAMKLIDTTLHPFEVSISNYFSSTDEIRNDPQNHCVPIIEVLKLPESNKDVILVMPFLMRFNYPKFGTVGECLAFFDQMFEGLKFIHDHNIAHRDAGSFNIMMDASRMYPFGYHPVATLRTPDLRRYAPVRTRTIAAPKYYLIDFGLSRQYDPDLGSDSHPTEMPIRGGDKTVPEHQGDLLFQPCNPFPGDVYYLGHCIEEEFLDIWKNLEFIRPLIREMTLDNLNERPTMAEVLKRFRSIQSEIRPRKFRSRLVRRDGWDRNPVGKGCLNIRHLFVTATLVAKKLPAIPYPP